MNRFFTLIYYKKLRNSRYMQRVGLVFAFLILTAIILPQSFRLQYQYEVGQTWRNSSLYAPFDFAIYKTQDSIEHEQNIAADLVLPIFLRDTNVERRSLLSLQEQLTLFHKYLTDYQQAVKNKDTSTISKLKRHKFHASLSINIDQALTYIDLFKPGKTSVKAEKITKYIYEKGYLNARVDTLPDVIALRMASPEEVHVASQGLIYRSNIFEQIDRLRIFTHAMEGQVYKLLIIRELIPNFNYSKVHTLEERRRVRALVSPVYGKITERSLIVEKGQIVDKNTGAILASLIREKEKRVGSQSNLSSFLSKVLIIFLITMILLVYLSVNQPRIYVNNIKLSLILFILLFAIGGMALASKLIDLASRLPEFGAINLSFIYLAPSCIVPIFISNFFGHRVGFLCNMLIALYGAVLVQQSLEFAFVQIIAGTIAVYSLRKIRKREVFFYTLLYIFIGYTLSYIAFNLYSQGGFMDINYSNISLFGINVAITIIAYNLIYVFEKIFGITSDLTYLELLDTNHPLLQQLARKAPGTFQHSLQVATIAEATINELGGNGLLTHVGALYHDVGKMTEPQFFIENQSNGHNPHDALSCNMSAEKIINHVHQGVEIAQKHKLPREIIKFIETHHGTTRVEYFYRIHLKERKCQPPEGEKEFRYKGPLPFSKETAVLMIADSVEAASKSLKKPTSDEIDKLVNGIIDHKIRDKQLEQSSLTFRDIATIRGVVSKQLKSIYHSRIEYPKSD